MPKETLPSNFEVIRDGVTAHCTVADPSYPILTVTCPLGSRVTQVGDSNTPDALKALADLLLLEITIEAEHRGPLSPKRH